MPRFLVWCAILIIAAAAIAGGSYVWLVRTAQAPGPLSAATTVIIAPGTGTAGIARELAQIHVIEFPLAFEFEVRRRSLPRALKPGEYRFDAGISLDAAIDKIVRHDVVARFVTVPEGLLSVDALRILDHADGLQGQVKGTVADGDLLPETYRYEWGDNKDAVVARMRAARENMLKDLWANRARDLPLNSPEEAIVLASIVEKETGIAAERPHVAAVFLNRLRRGMKLQSDPTVIYGLSPGQDPTDLSLTRADLERPSPYNTYVIDGLPPAPICNPGRAAIAAVLAPAASDDLYFVADGSGGHVFAATLDQHNRNVAHWRQIREQSRDQQRHQP